VPEFGPDFSVIVDLVQADGVAIGPVAGIISIHVFEAEEGRVMTNHIFDRGPLSIPSFASERCRMMAEELVLALEKIPTTDDQSLEDRALACFVVACNELSLMQDKDKREAIVGELTVAARRIIKHAAPSSETESDIAGEHDLQTEEARQEEQVEESTKHIGMTWDQVEVVLKQERAKRQRL
jgi:hypothetical protein